ncbi:MAG: hypothetical protein IKD31_04370 [Clostridia bacterium]|nr:hypothetical protein [Clostridia bacterium]
MAEKKKKQYVSDNAQLMAEWDWEKNGDLCPQDFTVSSNKEVWWKCSKGHSWKLTVYEKTAHNRKCPYCTNKRVLVGDNDLQTRFPHLVKEWNWEKNGALRPEDYVLGSAKKVWWKCAECGREWETSIRSRTQRKTGCPSCAIKKRASARLEKYISENGGITNELLLSEWNYQKNHDLLPQNFTPSSNKKVWWKCSECEYEWQAQICLRQVGRGCPCCSNRVVVKGKNDLATTNPELAKEWHPTKNDPLTPCDVTRGSGKKVWWKCPLGHEYKASVLHRGHGTNCPICNSGRQTSFAEQAVFYYVKELYPDAINRYKDIFDNGMELDIYIPYLRYAIEYDGSFWHNRSKYEREQRKYDICKSHGIKLIRIKAFEKEYLMNEPCFADYTLFLKEDSIPELEKLIQNLYFKLYNARIHPDIRWENAIETVNIERDRYKISRYLCEQRKSFADEHPELAKEWHPTKNEDLTPNMFQSGSDFLAWWKCSVCGHEWKTNIGFRVNGRGCKQCSIKNHSGTKHYNAKKIYQYTKEGTFIKEWGTLSEASKTLTINNSNISMCAEGKRAIAGGYRWAYERLEKLSPIEKQKKSRKGINGKPINQLDLQGDIVCHFISLNEAGEKTGINATSISKVLNGHIKTAGGFRWEFDEKDGISSIGRQNDVYK